MSLAIGAFGAAARFFFRSAARWRLERYAGATGFAQADRYGLLRRPCTMFAVTDVLDFFMHEFTSGRGWRLAFAKIFFCFLNSRFVRHNLSLQSRVLGDKARAVSLVSDGPLAPRCSIVTTERVQYPSVLLTYAARRAPGSSSMVLRCIMWVPIEAPHMAAIQPRNVPTNPP